MAGKMKRIWAVAIALVFLFSPLANALKFVAMADSRGSDNGVNSKVLSQIVQRVVEEKPAFVIFPGDLINGSRDDNIVKSEYARWREVMEPISSRVPLYIVPGNHEIQGPNQDRLFQQIFDMPKNGPKGYEGLCYSFDYENCHFVGLHTNYYRKQHRVQYGWLKKDLEATDKGHIFVFGHEPAYPVGPHVKSSLDGYPRGREKFWKLLVKHNARAYFCGHEHLYNSKNIDGVYQIINGTCGAPIKSGYGGAFYHYVLVSVEGKKIEVVIKDKNGKQKDGFVLIGD